MPKKVKRKRHVAGSSKMIRKARAPDGFEPLPENAVMDSLLKALGYKRSAEKFNAESKRLMGKP